VYDPPLTETRGAGACGHLRKHTSKYFCAPIRWTSDFNKIPGGWCSRPRIQKNYPEGGCSTVLILNQFSKEFVFPYRALNRNGNWEFWAPLGSLHQALNFEEP
jgi:hypothetical protein